jgi:predicted dehydrogenase
MTFHWGILGLGKIARLFAEGLMAVPDATLFAVGSRSKEKAESFGDEFAAAHRYGSYEQLVNDPLVDAVYIATPHTAHYADTVLSLNAGKPVLCEKPFTLNAKETSALIKLSRSKNIFLLEAMWTRFLPAMAKVRQLISEDVIGEVRLVEANFGFRMDFDPDSRLFSAELGGGALLDIGVYPISLASMLLGSPVAVTGLAQLGETGVDEQSAFVLKYSGGGLAVLSSAIRTTTSRIASIYGTKGRITIDEPWWIPKKLTLTVDGCAPEIIEPEFVGNGYNYEAIEVERCVRAGKVESLFLPHSESLEIMQTMDELRRQWGLVYPGENS